MSRLVLRKQKINMAGQSQPKQLNAWPVSYLFIFWLFETPNVTLFFPWNPKHVLWRLSYAVPCSCSFLNKRGYELKSPFISISLAIKSSHKRRINTNLLLTEGEGRSGEYWPEVVAVRTEQSEVRTKNDRGPIFPSAVRAS